MKAKCLPPLKTVPSPEPLLWKLSHGQNAWFGNQGMFISRGPVIEKLLKTDIWKECTNNQVSECAPLLTWRVNLGHCFLQISLIYKIYKGDVSSHLPWWWKVGQDKKRDSIYIGKRAILENSPDSNGSMPQIWMSWVYQKQLRTESRLHFLPVCDPLQAQLRHQLEILPCGAGEQSLEIP